MRLLAAILSMTIAAGEAVAADEPRRAQVAAATADALGALQDDVLSTPVTADLTVAQFVDKTDSREALVKALRRAELIGGTRWPDDQTCEVRMELSGSELAEALVQIAAANPRAAGLPPDVLRARVAGLRERTFAATGMSTSAIDHLRPALDDEAWRGVADEAVRAAIADARHSAARQVLESVEAIEAPGGAALGELFEDQQVRDALEGWAMNRPVTSVQFQPELEVRVTIAATGEDFWNELVAAVDDREDLPFPGDEEARRELRARVLRRVEPAVGRARAKGELDGGGGGAQPASDAASIPADPPRWVVRHADAKGAASPPVAGNSRLKTARAAEKAARRELSRQIDGLPLSRDLTLGDAARRDGRLRDAIVRTLRRAKVSKVNYLAGGSAEVSISLDLRELWYELDTLR